MTRTLGVGRILVIESDAETRGMLVKFFVAQGYRVEQAGDGEEGLYRAHEAEAPYDVVLLDDHLPDATGLEMLPALRAVGPDSLVILMSQSCLHQRFFEAMRCGASDFLQKPVWPQEALRVVACGIRTRRNGFAAEAVG
jgi:two-component system response regulator PhoP